MYSGPVPEPLADAASLIAKYEAVVVSCGKNAFEGRGCSVWCEI